MDIHAPDFCMSCSYEPVTYLYDYEYLVSIYKSTEVLTSRASARNLFLDTMYMTTATIAMMVTPMALMITPSSGRLLYRSALENYTHTSNTKTGTDAIQMARLLVT